MAAVQSAASNAPSASGDGAKEAPRRRASAEGGRGETPRRRASAEGGRGETPRRRTQEERRAATRAALLDAALECLVEHGYEGTTTGRVCERAGLSRGAHLHHFHTRPQLVAAALSELAKRREDFFRDQVAELPRGDGRVEAALDLIWGWFTGPLFAASVDLAAAARTDPELRASLAPIERGLSAETLRLCRVMFAADEQDPGCDQLIQMTLGTVRGLALLPILQPGNRSAAKQWAFARDQLAAAIRARSGCSDGS